MIPSLPSVLLYIGNYFFSLSLASIDSSFMHQHPHITCYTLSGQWYIIGYCTVTVSDSLLATAFLFFVSMHVYLGNFFLSHWLILLSCTDILTCYTLFGQWFIIGWCIVLLLYSIGCQVAWCQRICQTTLHVAWSAGCSCDGPCSPDEQLR
jgi:hypothetical protein